MVAIDSNLYLCLIKRKHVSYQFHTINYYSQHRRFPRNITSKGASNTFLDPVWIEIELKIVQKLDTEGEMSTHRWTGSSVEARRTKRCREYLGERERMAENGERRGDQVAVPRVGEGLTEGGQSAAAWSPILLVTIGSPARLESAYNVFSNIVHSLVINISSDAGRGCTKTYLLLPRPARTMFLRAECNARWIARTALALLPSLTRRFSLARSLSLFLLCKLSVPVWYSLLSFIPDYISVTVSKRIEEEGRRGMNIIILGII